jgi:hypothetical protein
VVESGQNLGLALEAGQAFRIERERVGSPLMATWRFSDVSVA